MYKVYYLNHTNSQSRIELPNRLYDNLKNEKADKIAPHPGFHKYSVNSIIVTITFNTYLHNITSSVTRIQNQTVTVKIVI